MGVAAAAIERPMSEIYFTNLQIYSPGREEALARGKCGERALERRTLRSFPPRIPREDFVKGWLRRTSRKNWSGVIAIARKLTFVRRPASHVAAGEAGWSLSPALRRVGKEARDAWCLPVEPPFVCREAVIDKRAKAGNGTAAKDAGEKSANAVAIINLC